jgi:AcrR family transcriptional regulator
LNDDSATPERILEGALRLLGRYGVKKLSMNDVGEAAGVTRGTVYRYFPSKSELIDALNHHENRQFELALREVATAHADTVDFLPKVLEFMLRYSQEHPVLHQLLDTEPAFMLGWIRSAFDDYVALLDEVLAPALVSPMPNGAPRDSRFTELILRVALSVYMFPNTDVALLARTISSLFHGAGYSTNAAAAK